MIFTKDNERQIEDSYGESGFRRVKGLSIALSLKNSKPSDTDFAVLGRVLLLDTTFNSTVHRVTGSYNARFCEAFTGLIQLLTRLY